MTEHPTLDHLDNISWA